MKSIFDKSQCGES